MTKAPRNRTIELSSRQISSLVKRAIKLSKKANIEEITNKIIWQDSFRALNHIPDKCVDLVIVDPPYNLTKVFSNKQFKQMDIKEYQKWLDRWLKKVSKILKDNGSIYICSDWKTSLAIPQVAQKYFILQNRISWEREKGRGALNNWKNCLEDIWFFTKSEKYTFHLDNTKGKPKDWQENEEGNKYRLTHPSNVWTDISIPFWSMPENTPHPTQKPEKLIAKLILASSNEQDLVFDPFLGSGTTAVTAKKLNRKYLGIEREKEYVAYSEYRLEKADEDKTIQGYENGVFKLRNE